MQYIKSTVSYRSEKTIHLHSWRQGCTVHVRRRRLDVRRHASTFVHTYKRHHTCVHKVVTVLKQLILESKGSSSNPKAHTSRLLRAALSQDERMSMLQVLLREKFEGADAIAPGGRFHRAAVPVLTGVEVFWSLDAESSKAIVRVDVGMFLTRQLFRQGTAGLTLILRPWLLCAAAVDGECDFARKALFRF